MKTSAILLLLCLLMPASWAAEPAAARSGDDIYRDFCAACHSGGWQGAPVANDKAEWAPRLEKGFDTLFQNAKQGVNGMPPMGVCMDCTDVELKAAIDVMLRFESS